MTMRVLGVDPGHKDCAIVVREGDQLVDHAHYQRDGQPRGLWAAWCADRVAYHAHWRAVDAVGIEDVAAPNPHVGRRNSDGVDRGPRFIDIPPLLDTAAVIGAVYAETCATITTVLVEPSGFGAPMPSRRHLLAAYPPELVGPRETTGAGKSVHQHARAAWDLAAVVPRLVRARAVEAGTG